MPNSRSITGRWTAKFRSRASGSAAWCQWWKRGVASSALERAPAPAQVGVDPGRLERHPDEVGRERRALEAEHEERHEDGRARREGVDQVEPRARQPVHGLARVVDRVEAPQEGHGVEGAVRGVAREVGHGAAPRATWSARGCAATACWSRGCAAQRKNSSAGARVSERRHLHQQVAREEVGEVGAPAAPEDRLLGPAREGALDRHEDEHEEQQVEHEPVEAEVARGRHRLRRPRHPPPRRAARRGPGRGPSAPRRRPRSASSARRPAARSRRRGPSRSPSRTSGIG